MTYIEEFKSVLFRYARDVQQYLSGGKWDYVYCAERSEEWGTFDKNYTNRTRFCYALLYDVCKVPDKKELVSRVIIFIEKSTSLRMCFVVINIIPYLGLISLLFFTDISII